MRDREHLDKTRTCLSAIRYHTRLSTEKKILSAGSGTRKASAVDMIAFGVLPNLILSQFFLSLEGTKAEMTILIVTVHIQWKAWQLQPICCYLMLSQLKCDQDASPLPWLLIYIYQS